MYDDEMSKVVQARLDADAEAALARLRRTTGLRDSELLRLGLRELDGRLSKGGAVRVIGVGKFASGRSDLGSNKRHLARFGR
jgi:hypothetical protein